MRRDPSLIPLSRQHQHALALCVRIERALEASAADMRTWQLEMRQLYANEVQFHFAAEEAILFPTARRFPELASLVEELIGEHERLREYFALAKQGTMSEVTVAMFATLLSGHIRKEERQLFEGMQKMMRPEELESMGKALARVLANSTQACRIDDQ